MQRSEAAGLNEHFSAVINKRCNPQRHGDLASWLAILQQLPELHTSQIQLDADAITIGSGNELSEQEQNKLETNLRALSPWRKGPYRIFDIFIDTEWRSDWKWNRLLPHISSLSGKRVLDVGCGTGYHCWRMRGAGADWVLGIDPSMRFVVQNLAIQKYARDAQFNFIPLGIEDMPQDWPVFDSVFSMGVLYHRRNPINHLMELKGLLSEGGELVLETLVVDPQTAGLNNGILKPDGRYAMMRNVWSLLTVDKTLELLKQAGYTNVRCVDINVTTIEEQRSTDWMTFHSLQNFLDPDDHSLTIEGYPAPKRAIFLAKK